MQNAIDTRTAGKLLTVGRNRLIKALLENGWIVATEFGYRPRQKYCLCGYLTEKTTPFIHGEKMRYATSVQLTDDGLHAAADLLRTLDYDVPGNLGTHHANAAAKPRGPAQPARPGEH